MKQQTAETNARPIDDQLNGFERLRLSWRLFRDERVPVWMKALVPIVATIYLLAPIDLIPDFILGLGQIDDLSVIGFAVFLMTKLLPRIAPRNVIEEHLADMRGGRRTRREGANVIDTTFQVVDEPAHDARRRGFDGFQETQA
jgi:uncharacterized membrane protein YkvA (DUF1232 family)